MHVPGLALVRSDRATLPHHCFHFQLNITEYVDSLKNNLYQLRAFAAGNLICSPFSTYLYQFPFISTVRIPCHGHSKSGFVISV